MPDEFNADPTVAWDTSLSDRHRELDRELNTKLDDFEAGQGLNPLAVVGPYGAGKTQYLYEVCRRGWKRDIPAVYTDLKTILDAHESSDKPIVEWLEENISQETSKILKGEDSDWLPEFRTTERKDEFYSNFIQGSNISTDKRILLIDEVEQKYEELDEYMDVDDANPLREILDGLTDIFQVWSFGLVSAYELIGEADRRRFSEARIPIIDVDTIWDQLNNNHQPTTLSNGLWWLSRGRAGWITNHSSNLPSAEDWNDDSFIKWFDESSSHSYYGADSIAPVWSDSDVPGNKLIDAKRTVLFEQPAYDDWIIESTNTAISVSEAHTVLLDAIQNQAELSGDVFEIISDNLLDVLEGFSPPTGWVTEDTKAKKKFLPSGAFSRDEYMEGLLKTVIDFISSFEKRGDTRKDATQLLGDVDITSIANTWSNLYDPLEKIDEYDVQVWTVNPAIIREAYPPLALNPEELTEMDTIELRKANSSAIRFDPQLSFRGGNLKVRLCPTEDALQSVFEKLSEQSDVTETTVVLLPDSTEAEKWSIPTHAKRLTEHELLTIEYVGGQRLWDFILQLNHYLDIHDFSGVIGSELIEKTVIPQATDDQVRNTINALFTDLERLGTQSARSSKASFTNAYTLQETEYLIWQDPALDGRMPYYGKSSTSATPKHGLEYGLVFAERSINKDVPHQQLISALEQAYHEDYAPNTRWFRAQYFFNRVFEGENNGIHGRAMEVRHKYLTEDGQLRRPVLRLQRALAFLCELNNEGKEVVYDRIVHINKDRDEEEKGLAVLTDLSAGKRQTEDLFRGLLLEWVLHEDSTLLVDDLKDLQHKLNKLDRRMGDVNEQIEYLNKNIEPPADVTDLEPIRFQESNVSAYRENIQAVSEGVGDLATEVENNSKLAAAAAVLWSIADRYESVMQNAVDQFQDPLGKVNLYSNINELKDEYRSLRKWLNSTTTLSQTSINQAELQTFLDELGRCVFDFSTRLGTSEVPIERSDLLETLDRHVEDDVNQLNQLNKKTKEIDNQAAEAAESAETVVNNLQEFSNYISFPGGEV
ncbi:hypothetical protein [Natronobacterium texcoconense]|uniref:Uncharacterized protein n=1 Tax=Natronobacterium texcoconense TaxID=1095778 RepID=A0A1H1CEP5_NATTX|nr:hypothetical protein [Natronobacterium texcoconense]SDQ62665.1 hypothetical protein SAMN04489842_1378 [Natronobacterium texcoconense]